jgi:hypothetical protein
MVRPVINLIASLAIVFDVRVFCLRNGNNC